MESRDTPFNEMKSLIIEGEDKRAKPLIESAGLHNAVDNRQRTLLHFSVEYNAPSMVRYLLHKGCDANLIDATGHSPLMLALGMNKEEVLRLLLDAGGDIDQENRIGQSALRMALNDHCIADSVLQLILENLRKKCGSSEKTAKRLMDERCRVDQAAFLKDARIVDCMLTPGAQQEDERTALHVAASLDDVHTVKLLVDKCADLHRARDRHGATALNYVYRYDAEHTSEKLEILKILLKRGVLPTDCTGQGDFQVGPTLLKGSGKAIRVLMRSQIDCSARDESARRTVLHHLAENVNAGLTKVLKPYIGQFDVNALDRFGSSPLYRAASSGNAEMVQFLLEHGAEVDLVHGDGHFTPLFEVYASWNPNFSKRYGKCVKLLLQHNADPQFVVDRGYVQPTIFTIAGGTRKMRPIVARLALMGKHGETITDVTRDEINSRRSLTNYWKRCQKMLNRRVAGEVTVYDLLTCDRKRMARYAKRMESFRIVKKIKYKRELKINFSYYHDTIKRRLSKNSKYVKLQPTVRAFLCELFQNRVDPFNIIIEEIEDYLDYKSLENLYELGRVAIF